jgi:hypothetical protein
MAEREDGGDVAHRHPVVVRGPNRLIAVASQFLGRLLQFLPALSVADGERDERGAGLRRFALRTGDAQIVDRIPANELAGSMEPSRWAGDYPRK